MSLYFCDLEPLGFLDDVLAHTTLWSRSSKSVITTTSHLQAEMPSRSLGSASKVGSGSAAKLFTVFVLSSAPE